MMISIEKALAAVLAVTLVNGFFSTNMMKKYKKVYSNQVENLKLDNSAFTLYNYDHLNRVIQVYNPLWRDLISKELILNELYEYDGDNYIGYDIQDKKKIICKYEKLNNL